MEKYKVERTVVPVYISARGQTGRYSIQLTHTVKFSCNITKRTE